MTNLQFKRNILLVSDVTMGNPNGDPDFVNRPRQIAETGKGVISNMCIKRKLRDVLADMHKGEDGWGLYVEPGASLTDVQKDLITSLGLDPKKKDGFTAQQKADIVDLMCKTFFDVRFFGAVATQVDRGIRGPIQVTDAVSVDPVTPESMTITCVSGAGEKGGKARDKNMGKRWYLPYGLYTTHIEVTVPNAEKVGFTEEDYNEFLKALVNIFSLSQSATNGEQALRRAIVFEHTSSRYGDQPREQLYDMLTIKKTCEGNPQSYDDYEVELDTSNLSDSVKVIELV